MKAYSWIIPAALVALFVRRPRRRKRPTNMGDTGDAPGTRQVIPDGASRVLPGVGDPMRATASGQSGTAHIDAQLEGLDRFLESAGVDMNFTNARELTRMKTGAVAIPPVSLWPNIVPSILLWQEQIRRPLGFPMKLSAYRPSDYNAAVGGKPRSLHQWFAALDIRPAGDHNTAANRRRIALAGARAYLGAPRQLQTGYGAYGFPDATNIHMDTGFRRRTWRDAPSFISQISQA